ncbi:hypothetical protein [Salinibacter ruber]|jgi:hypothetical protein|uniref:hypothetical protein n=1 Tax=Salinibacter ruber TaxID=146919 RepID=UPI0013C2C3C8|nr:hypothetical protein [Salinibacter ruber]MCS3650145.1 hypothetical protein [Salinibacter ruber]MCS3653398.1 hypothetical protein [Salinibacter ruber]
MPSDTPSSDAESSSQPNEADASDPPRKPFVEPELRHETDLIRGTGDRHFFESTAS